MASIETSPPPEAPAAQARHPISSRFRLIRNPVVLKELRGRMRGMRAFAVLTVYLTLMSGFVTLLYVLYASSLAYSGYASGGQIGRVLFIGIVVTELFLVSFIAPTFTAGAISGEHERQTYDLLRTTLLPARSLVLGKLISALSYVFLLLLAAIPLQSIAFLFGGVTEVEVILSFVILIITAIMLGSVGIYFSAHMKRTLSASMATYGVALFVTFVLPVLVLIIRALANGVKTLSPALDTLLVGVVGLLTSTNPLATAAETEAALINNPQTGLLASMSIKVGPQYYPFPPSWIIFTLIYLMASAVMVMLAIRRVRRIEA